MDPYTPLQSDQGWLIDTANKLLLLNLNDEIIALTNVCTHARCTTDWDYDSGNEQFLWMCHNSVFDAIGNVKEGPATVALERFEVSRDGNMVTVTR